VARRNARILAFQALFSWDVGGTPIEDVLQFNWTEKLVSPMDMDEEPVSKSDKQTEEETFARFLVSGAVEHIQEIDEKIASHLQSGWSMERLNKVALAAMRLAIYEMTWQTSVDHSIVIDEAVTIVKDFSPDESYRFVNAVLDKISKESAS